MANTKEELLNGALARGLKARGIEAEAELKHIDVVVNTGGVRVAIEAKNGHRSKRNAIRAADGRIKQGRANTAVAVCYPDGADEDTLDTADLRWAIRKDTDAAAEWQRGDMDGLAAALRAVPQSAGDADSAARVLSKALDDAVDSMSEGTRQTLADRLGIRHKDSRKAAKRGMLVVATSMLFHHRLQGYLPRKRPAGWDGQWPPATPQTCAEGDATAHRTAWRAILAVDYKPVFETAIVALDALPIDAGTTAMLRQLADSVSGIAAETVGLRHDLLGRIFHRVLDTAKQDGSFYTSTAAATLLAALAIRDTDVDWSDADAIARLRICDPACGTGTLLMAAYERIYQMKQSAGAMDTDSEALLAQLMVEQVLWGYDINLTATHMTASTLGMMSPKTQFDKMNVHRAPLGVYAGVPYLGSLEALGGQMRLSHWPSTRQQVEQPVDTPYEADLPEPMDLVIMNPPFTRQDLRHDQMDRKSELAIKQREKELLGKNPHRGAARLHSSGGMFAVLSHYMTKPTGTIAMIYPSVVATSPGNLEMRKFLASEFHVDTIVSSHDPKRIFFSENTTIGEILLVCRRWDSNVEKPPTRVINLMHNPATPTEALRLISELDKGDTDMGTIQIVPAATIAAGDWTAMNFLSPLLTEAYRTQIGSDLVPITDVAEIRSAGRLLSIYYSRTDKPRPNAKRALYYHKSGVTQSMRARTDSYILARPGKEGAAERMWKERSHLLIADRLYLPKVSASAVMLDEQALGGAWTACKTDNASTAGAICAYLNSSVGMLGTLGGRVNRIPSYPKFQTATLRSLRVPNFREHSEARRALAKAYTQLKDATLAPFPQMAEDPVRRKLDDAVCAALSLDAEWVASVRSELAREPSVTGKRHESLART